MFGFTSSVSMVVERYLCWSVVRDLVVARCLIVFGSSLCAWVQTKTVASKTTEAHAETYDCVWLGVNNIPNSFDNKPHILGETEAHVYSPMSIKKCR